MWLTVNEVVQLKQATWISLVAEVEADDHLQQIFDKSRTPHGTLDNVIRIHSLRPAIMIGHLTLYKSVLHSDEITLSLWFLEVIAAYVSILNSCEYSLMHHWRNGVRLIDNPQREAAIQTVLRSQSFENIFNKKEIATLNYSRTVICDVGNLKKNDVTKLRKAGCDDMEILEMNEVIAYFNYSNRVLNGLGVSLDGDKIGYYSS